MILLPKSLDLEHSCFPFKGKAGMGMGVITLLHAFFPIPTLMKLPAIRLGCQPKSFWLGTRKTPAKSLITLPLKGGGLSVLLIQIGITREQREKRNELWGQPPAPVFTRQTGKHYIAPTGPATCSESPADLDPCAGGRGASHQHRRRAERLGDISSGTPLVQSYPV